MRKIAVLLALPVLVFAGASGLFTGDFWKTWGDGQAELASYDLTEPHYGKPRQGVAVAIWVSETFSLYGIF